MKTYKQNAELAKECNVWGLCLVSCFSRVSLWPHRPQLTRFLCPMRFSVVGILEQVSIALLQGIFPTWGMNPHLLCLLHCRQILYHSHQGSPTRECVLMLLIVFDSLRPPGSEAQEAPLSMGILQARILKWVVMPSSSRWSSQPSDQTQVFPIAGRCFTVWATRGATRE